MTPNCLQVFKSIRRGWKVLSFSGPHLHTVSTATEYGYVQFPTVPVCCISWRSVLRIARVPWFCFTCYKVTSVTRLTYFANVCLTILC